MTLKIYKFVRENIRDRESSIWPCLNVTDRNYGNDDFSGGNPLFKNYTEQTGEFRRVLCNHDPQIDVITWIAENVNHKWSFRYYEEFQHRTLETVLVRNDSYYYFENKLDAAYFALRWRS